MFTARVAILGILLFGFIGGQIVQLLWKAGTAALRPAADYLLAGVWNSGAVPNPLWRTGKPRLLWLYAPSHGRPHGGTIPATRARTLGLRPIHQREQGVGLISRCPGSLLRARYVEPVGDDVEFRLNLRGGALDDKETLSVGSHIVGTAGRVVVEDRE